MRASRRNFLQTCVAAPLLAGCALPPAGDSAMPPVIFVHGNGDTAALWLTTLWRFESNGWPRDRLFAPDLPYPGARSDDSKAQPGRSSSAENTQALAAEIGRVRRLTGAAQVVLVGNSRGGYAIRDLIHMRSQAGGPQEVSHAVLCGVPNHGVWAGSFNPGSEFNGSSPFLAALNAPRGAAGLEVDPGVRFMTLRSDGLDKYAQPDGRWIGQPNLATNVDSNGPALNGAQNQVLPGRDHRETAFHPGAFAAMWRFLTGRTPVHLAVAAEGTVMLDGRITGFLGADPTNLPLAGARLEVFATDPATGLRKGAAVHQRTVGEDGRYGPFAAQPGQPLEFVIHAPGLAVTHIYRAAFPRSTAILHMRPAAWNTAEDSAGSVLVYTRPRGYLATGRDAMRFDGAAPPGIGAGVPGISVARIRLPDVPDRPVIAELNGERIVMRAWPARERHVSFAEFHY